ncbi:hypothetical protein [Mycolicibacterium fortuitum]|uniref:hypothetical protein n=1 Tax=Mycolicibacterium fortuitum TaxID=1766 RepID=UPI003AAF5F92
MAAVQSLRKLVTSHGFVEHHSPGFVGFHRRHDDGREQNLSAFWWANAKHAAAKGIPRSYMVVCLDPGGGAGDGRFRLPLVRWPAPVEGQTRRPWAEVATEFEDVFWPIYDLPAAEGRELIAALGDRYQIL